MHLLIHWIVDALIILAVARLLPGVKLRSFGTAMAVALVLGVLNVLLGWWLTLLGAALTLFLLAGLVRFLVNTFLLWLTDKLLAGFEIEGLGTLFLASFLMSVLHHIALRLL
jgi:putative membrane protein